MNAQRTILSILPALPFLLVSCSFTNTGKSTDATDVGQAPIVTSFRPLGQASLDRLTQDEVQRVCSEYEGLEVPAELVAKITASSAAAVVFPSDGNYFGDWRAGKVVAETGTGLQSNDNPSIANGGNCYACHQMAPDEIAFGTLGLPLVNYGKLRGTSEPILKYTWTRLWDSHSYNVCSHMPRFGANGILSEQQLKDLMAFLFDPQSPVNKEVVAP